MKVRLNEDRQVVDAIREGLKRTGGYCPCRLARTEENRCMCKEFKDRSLENLKHQFYICSQLHPPLQTTLNFNKALCFLTAKN